MTSFYCNIHVLLNSWIMEMQHQIKLESWMDLVSINVVYEAAGLKRTRTQQEINSSRLT